MTKAQTIRKISGVFILAFIFAGCSQAMKPTVEPSVKKEVKPPVKAAPSQGKTAVKSDKKKAAKKEEPRREDAGHLVADKLNHDFGVVEPGEQLKGEYVLTNDGQETLKISGVGKQCGCTQPNLDTKILEPGQSTKLSFTYKAASKAGKANKKVWVNIEAPGLPKKLTLSLTADIKELITVRPKKLGFELNQEAQNDVVVVVESTKGDPFKVTGFTCRGKTAKVTYDPELSAAQHTLSITPDLAQLRKNPNGVITIKTNHPKVKTVSVAFSSTLPFSAHPPTKSFLKIKPGEAQKTKIKVVANFGQEFELASTTSEKGLIEVLEQTKTADGYQLEIALSVPPETKKKYVSDYLIIKIKDHPEDTLKVHCYGRITK